MLRITTKEEADEAISNLNSLRWVHSFISGLNTGQAWIKEALTVIDDKIKALEKDISDYHFHHDIDM